MSFDPRCARHPRKPAIYLVQRFCGPGTTGAPGTWSSYPLLVRSAFLEAMKANLALLTMGDRRTPRDKWKLPLFALQLVDALELVPRFPLSGDVVLRFLHAPEEYRAQSAVATLVPPDDIEALDSLTTRAGLAAMERYFYEPMVARWSALFREKPPPLEVGGPGGDVGVAVYETFVDGRLTLRASGRRLEVVCRRRLGLVDVGAAAASALQVWADSKVRVDLLGRLLAFKPALGPAAVAEVGTARPPREAERYFAAVGRGLAYSVLHECWHAICARSDHPFGEGNLLIEGRPSGTKVGLRFHPQSVRLIQDHYAATWCRDVTAKKAEFASLPSA